MPIDIITLNFSQIDPSSHICTFVDKFVATSLGGDYFCSLCGSKFHFKSELKRHLRCGP